MSTYDTIKHDCPHCGVKSVGFFKTGDYTFPKNKGMTEIYNCGHCYEAIVLSYSSINHTMQLRETYPKPQIRIPEYLPSDVERFFKQGLENLSGNFDAAGMMFRKSLERGLGQKYPETKGKLYAVIKQLGAENKLTPDMVEWSHHIRQIGNDAAHEDEFTQEQAEEMRHFTELVLTYVYTLSTKIERYKKD
ncbi:DUF4145 domain-containing protein [Thalassospira sp.]|uniref:DUF4145 domain-containing protein n=1 Tax=Thalassospira sp. TaxID=1912094 RepID=UPI003AA7BD13